MKAWTTERVATLREYVALDLSASVIGDRLGETKNTIIGQCTRHGFQLNGTRAKAPRAKRVVHLDIAVRESQARRSVIQKETREPVGLLKLRNYHCREVVGVGDDGLATFCGSRKIDKISYCAVHTAKNFNT